MGKLIGITQPCSASWEAMTPNERGRFCDQCAKTVVDLTQKTQRQIHALHKASGGQMCGRMTLRQMMPQPRPTLPASMRRFVLVLLSILGYITLTPELMKAQDTSKRKIADSSIPALSGGQQEKAPDKMAKRAEQGLLLGNSDEFTSANRPAGDSQVVEPVVWKEPFFSLPRNIETVLYPILFEDVIVMGGIAPMPNFPEPNLEQAQEPILFYFGEAPTKIPYNYRSPRWSNAGLPAPKSPILPDESNYPLLPLSIHVPPGLIQRKKEGETDSPENPSA